VSYRMVTGWRIASLAAILGLLGSGVAGLALVDAPQEPAAAKSPVLGGPLRLARPQQTARAGLGLRLLQEAAAACAGTSYSGAQVVVWWGQGEKNASVVEVWHQPGRATLVQQADSAPEKPGSPGTAMRSVPDGVQDPDEVLDVSQRLLTLLQTNYQVVYAGRGSAVGRTALVVEVRRPGGGLAARFWLDAATKLPLRRQIFAVGTRMISEDAFVTLELGARGLGKMPAPAAAPWTVQLDQVRLAALRAKGWPLPGQLPDNLLLFAATETSARPGPVVDLSYSDGLTVVSLFVQRGELAQPMPGWRQVGMAGRTIYAVEPDQRSFAWSASGFVYTVIADAPVATVRQVVAALPGSTEPGFWGRIARGFRRLASSFNPLR
jgi:sigma-E factor negative regulatory protein RseB